MIIALPSLGPGSPSPMSFSNPVDLEMAESDSPCTEGASGRSDIQKKRRKRVRISLIETSLKRGQSN